MILLPTSSNIGDISEKTRVFGKTDISISTACSGGSRRTSLGTGWSHLGAAVGARRSKTMTTWD